MLWRGRQGSHLHRAGESRLDGLHSCTGVASLSVIYLSLEEERSFILLAVLSIQFSIVSIAIIVPLPILRT